MENPRFRGNGGVFLHISHNICLSLIELGVHAALFHQLLVGAGFGDEAIGDGDDAACRPDGGKPVGDDEGGSGIYEELINSIKSINTANLRLLFRGQFRSFWQGINANFLLSIVLGIGISIFSLAKIITIGKPTYFGMGLLLRVGVGLYLVCRQGDQAMESKNCDQFRHWLHLSFLHHNCDAF